MDPVIFVLVALVLAGIAAYFFSDSVRVRKLYVDTQRQLEETTSKKSSKSTQKDKKKSAPTVSEKDLKEAQDEAKKLKQKLYDANQELEAAQKKIEDLGTPKATNVDAVFELREELGRTKADLATWKERAEAAEKASVRAEKKVEKAPEVVVQSTGDADLDEINARHAAEVKNLRDKIARLERETRDKLKNTSRNVDRQRRRADNNDRAYKITQRQLDAALEKIMLMEEQLKKAGFLSQESVTAPSGKPVETVELASAPPEPAKEAPEATPEAAQAEAPEVKEEAPEVKAEAPEEEAAEAAPEAKEEEAPAQKEQEVAAAPEAPEEEPPRKEETLGPNEDTVQGMAPISEEEDAEQASAEEEESGQTIKAAPVSDQALADAQSSASDDADDEDEDDDRGQTQVLTPSALAEAVTNGDAGLQVASGLAEASAVDDAWAELDVDQT